jgi:hypothetical protein
MNWASQSIITSNDNQDNQSTETNKSQSMKWRHDDLSRGSRTYRHANPRCVPLNHVVRWLIGHTPSLSKDATRTYQIARSCNDTSNILMLPCGTPPGKVQTPHKITGGGQEQSPTLATPLSCSKPSRCAATTKSNKKNHSKSIPQVSLDANQWSMHLNHSISLKDRNRMQRRWVGMRGNALA